MRQAGRYLPGYQRIRGETDFLDLCKTPDLAAEVSVEPLEVLDVDAVIIFSDILVPLEAMGLKVEFGDSGPCMSNPLRDRADIEVLNIPDPVESTGFVMDVIRAVHERVQGKVPVIGFAGAPWTLSCYALEGSPSRTFAAAQRLIYESPADLHLLMEKISDTVVAYLRAQVEAGANAVQLFDSWAGCLSPDDYARYVLPFVQQIVSSVATGVPVINFATGNPALLPLLAQSGCSVVGVDWRY